LRDLRLDLVNLLADESAIDRLAIHDLERPTTDLQMHIGATQFVAALQQTREADIGERAHDVCIHNHSGHALDCSCATRAAHPGCMGAIWDSSCPKSRPCKKKWAKLGR
jgi:hypothetical protein